MRLAIRLSPFSLRKLSRASVQGAIYSSLSPDIFRKFHDEGFEIEGRTFKLFTFSDLIGRRKVEGGNGDAIYHFPRGAILKVSSPIQEFILDLSTNLMKKGYLQLNGTRVEVEGVKVSPVEEVQPGIYRTLSPLVVLRNRDGWRESLDPWDPLFQERLESNAKLKAELIFGNSSGSLVVEPLSVKQVSVRYNGMRMVAWKGIFRLKGDERLLKAVYLSGAGSKNSAGFGMLEHGRRQVGR